MKVYFQKTPTSRLEYRSEYTQLNFVDISVSFKNFILKHGFCKNCKSYFNPTNPFCGCPSIDEVIFPTSLHDYLSEQDYAERRRIRAKFTSDIYKEKKLLADGIHTKDDIDKIYKLQNGLCYYCLEKVGNGNNEKKYERDHLIPLSNGGTNWPNNIVIACKECNRLKRDLSGIAYWNKLKKLIDPEIVLNAQNIAKLQKKEKDEIAQIRKNIFREDFIQKILQDLVIINLERISQLKKTNLDDCIYSYIERVIIQSIHRLYITFSQKVYCTKIKEKNSIDTPNFILFLWLAAYAIELPLKNKYKNHHDLNERIDPENIVKKLIRIPLCQFKNKKREFKKAKEECIYNIDKYDLIISNIQKYIMYPSKENENIIYDNIKRLS